MTKAEILKACEMRLNGFSYQLIAEKLGYTRQNVHSVLQNAMKERAKYKRRACKVNTVYPAIGSWMYSNNVTIGDLAEKIGITYQNLYKRLKGKHPFKVAEIQRVLAVTGLKFEDVFKE